MIHLSQELTWTEKNDMKNLIIKWLGLEGLIDEVVRIKTRDAIASFKNELVDYANTDLNNRYDLEGIEGKLDDVMSIADDLEYKSERWDAIADKVEDEPDTFLLDKVQSVDDRLTELVAGYKLDVQLVKEDF